MIEVTRVGDMLKVKSPYDPEFISRVKQLGGMWSNHVWNVPARAEPRLRETLMDLYKYNGFPEGPTCSVQVRLIGSYGNDLWIGPVLALHKMSRDRAPILGENTWVVKGQLMAFGGSAKHPRITFEPGTTLQIDDFPMATAQILVSEDPEMYQIVKHVAEFAPYELTVEEQALVGALADLPTERRQVVYNAVADV